ncbi:hypothetical protein ABC733_18930 [Mangrovibacter sp. SLW1]
MSTYTLPQEYINEALAGVPVRTLDKKYHIDKNISPLLRANAGLKVSSHKTLETRSQELNSFLMSANKLSQRDIAKRLGWSIGTLQNVLRYQRSL